MLSGPGSLRPARSLGNVALALALLLVCGAAAAAAVAGDSIPSRVSFIAAGPMGQGTFSITGRVSSETQRCRANRKVRVQLRERATGGPTELAAGDRIHFDTARTSNRGGWLALSDASKFNRSDGLVYMTALRKSFLRNGKRIVCAKATKTVQLN